MYKNLNLNIKRFLLFPLNIKSIAGKKIIKRGILALGNSICCPAVTYVNDNIKEQEIFREIYFVMLTGRHGKYCL